MKRSRFTQAQIVSILHEYDAGTPIVELAGRHGVHATPCGFGRVEYGGRDVSDLARLSNSKTRTRECGVSSRISRSRTTR